MPLKAWLIRLRRLILTWLNVKTGSKEFDATRYQSDAALLLWNVLGHIRSEERAVALKNVAELTS